MQDLNDLLYFAEVVDRGGFAAAGRALGVPKSRLSRRVAELEALDPPAPDGQTRIWLLQQEGDEVLDYRVALDYYRACQITREAGGNHAFIGFERHCAGIVEFLHL